MMHIVFWIFVFVIYLIGVWRAHTATVRFGTKHNYREDPAGLGWSKTDEVLACILAIFSWLTYFTMRHAHHKHFGQD